MFLCFIFFPFITHFDLKNFFFPFLNFNWRLIILQYCGGFVIRSLESALGVRVSPILTLPPTCSLLYSSLATTWESLAWTRPKGLQRLFTYLSLHVS